MVTALYVLCIAALFVGAYLIAVGNAIGLVVFAVAMAVMWFGVRLLPKEGGGSGSEGGHVWDGDGGGGGGGGD